MWGSRVLGEISKVLWTEFCDVHRTDISTARFIPSLADLDPTRYLIHTKCDRLCVAASISRR
jgi:hypothetical protein